MPEVGDELSVTIERLSYGPDAVARSNGQVVFVPRAAPGDELVVTLSDQRRTYARGDIVSVRQAGPGRAEPRCPAFGECGGCQWQHLDPALQATAKRDIVAELLRRLGGLVDPPVEPTICLPDPWAYRSRITLAADAQHLGFRRAQSHQIVEIAGCPIADVTLSDLLPRARQWATELGPSLERLTLTVGAHGAIAVAQLSRRSTRRQQRTAAALVETDAALQGMVLLGDDDRAEVGDVLRRLPVEPDLDLEVPADAFTQVSAAGNLALVTAVLERAAIAPEARVLDLFCGAGNFGLPLARRGARLHGVDTSAVAVQAARTNAARLGLDAATFEVGEARDALGDGWPGETDLVVLDPPRRGIRDLVAPLLQRRPAHVLYVSCDPATLARDLRDLVGGGYRLAHVRPIDLFPHTYHVEAVADLWLT
jgi:23S rRNA (uracil1939-C5)-methyltransferase